jgi:mono/diheme cytochrome c family protein
MLGKFFRNKWMIAVCLAVVTLAFPLLARAGGWAVLTLETWPAEVLAERPFTIEFVVRQHGAHLMSGLSPVVTAVHPDSGDKVTFEAVAAAEEGHYQAELTLPHSGEWEWQINAFAYDHVMPPLQVMMDESVVDPTKQAAIPTSVPFTIGIASLVATAVGLWAWGRQRTQLRLAFVAIMAAVAVAALAVPWRSETAVAEQTNRPTLAAAEMGEVLFVAKGCITCHQHDGITLANNFAAIGPNLSHYAGDPDYLQSWLKDPAALKPTTIMPDLALSEEEIQILAAFLSQKGNERDS